MYFMGEPFVGRLIVMTTNGGWWIRQLARQFSPISGALDDPRISDLRRGAPKTSDAAAT